MKSTLFFTFGVLLCGILLHLFPYNETKVALLRLEGLWTQSKTEVLSQIRSHCSQIKNQRETTISNAFYAWLTEQEANPNIKSKCLLEVHSAQAHRFNLKINWVVTFQLREAGKAPFIERTFHLQTPTPLCLLPIFMFVLALIFRFPLWGLGCTVFSYLFFLSAGNLIQTGVLIYENLLLSLRSDQTLISFAFVIFWLSIVTSVDDKRPTSRPEKNEAEKFINRGFSSLVGLWNPILFTLFGRYLVSRTQEAVSSFLDAQLILTCLSLYLLTIGFATSVDSYNASLLLPRYFTFAAVIFFVGQYWFSPKPQAKVLWHIPHLWRGATSVCALEGLAFFFPAFLSLSFVTRIGLALVLSELIFPFGIPWFKVFKRFFPWFGVLLLCYFMAVLSQKTGVLELLLVAMDPRKHPNFLTFWTFLAGAVFGFFTGSFSLVYFTFLAFMKSPKVPILNAALLDGVLVGVLLSPFSLFNLLPAIQFKQKPADMIRFRFRQMAIPLFIGFLIYAIATFSSVALLQPVTFVFCCMVAFALRLRKSKWSLDTTD